MSTIRRLDNHSPHYRINPFRPKNIHKLKWQETAYWWTIESVAPEGRFYLKVKILSRRCLCERFPECHIKLRTTSCISWNEWVTLFWSVVNQLFSNWLWSITRLSYRTVISVRKVCRWSSFSWQYSSWIQW